MYLLRKVRNIGLNLIIGLSIILYSFCPAFALKPTGGFSAPYFQADYIQDLSEFSSSLINPALLYRVNQYRLEAGFYRWGGANPFGEELGYNQGTFLFPIRLRHTIGLSAIASGSDFESTTLDPYSMAVKRAGSDEFLEVWFIGHYSFLALPWLSVGCNPKLVVQNQPKLNADNDVDEYSAGFGLDIGVYGNIFDHYRFGDLGVSLNFQDIIPANLKWRNPDGPTAKQLMTTRFRGGLRYAIMNDRMIFDAEVVVDNLFQNMWDFLIDVTEKGDYTLDTTYDSSGTIIDIDSVYEEDDLESYLDKIGRVSAHWKFQWIPQLWFKLGWANNNIPYIGFNCNVIYLFPEMINYASVDLHIGYSINETERGLTFMTKLATDFGPTREQRESKRLYDKLVVAPMSAYNEAMRLYVAGKFWEASFAFGKVLALFPNFHLNDKATYYMGDCYTQLDLNDIARQVFKDGLAEYATSEVRANYLYGLQNLDYREGKFKDALKNHAFISNLYSESEVKSNADYLAGEIHFLKKNYSAATQLLDGIGRESESYNYAQYTLAVINIENDRTKAAIKNLENIIIDTTETDAMDELRNAACNKLGQLYFEEVQLREAVGAFNRVPENSEHGDESLLGTAWSWIKVNRPQECLNNIERLILIHPKSPLIPESYLLKGYSLMLLSRNREALTALNECLKLCRTEFVTEDDLSFEKQKFVQYANDFAPVAAAIKKNALRKPTDKILGQREDLKTEYDKYAKEARDLFFYKLLVQDNKKFFRQKEQILMDAEYAIAKVTKIIGTTKEQEILDKAIKETEEIDEKMQKLQQKLEDLDSE